MSKIDPVEQSERIARSISVRERTLYLCPSPLLGYGLKTLNERLAKDSAILCVEADEKLFKLSAKSAVFNEGENSLRLEKIRAEENSPEELCAMVSRRWGKRRFRRVETVRLNGGWQLYPDFYEKTAAALQREIALSWGNAMTLIKLGRLYSRNFFKNLSKLSSAQSVTELDYGSDPVLVLGAGPSLDQLLSDLQKHFGRQIENTGTRPFRIICADTAVLSLKDRNISPDLVVILESQHWNLRDFIGAAGWKADTACDMSALHGSMKILKGKNYLFSIPWTELSVFKRLENAALLPPAMTPLGSVGLTAMEIALKLGSGKIIAGGLDFSFSMDAYHARSTPGHKAKLASINRFKSALSANEAFREGCFSADSKQNKKVKSDPSLRNYRDLFEAEFGANKRIYQTDSSGLNLGCEIISNDKAAEILASAQKTDSINREADHRGHAEKYAAFIEEEKKCLTDIKATLTGSRPENVNEKNEFEKTLAKCDYLWAHFPEYAGTGSLPDFSDISFLKRIRAETDPFLELCDFALREINLKAIP